MQFQLLIHSMYSWCYDWLFSIYCYKCQVRGLPSKSTSGPDGFPQILFKQMAHQLTKPLVLLFRQLLQIGQLPDIWKIATVTPLFKKGSSPDPSNY